jgi:hypothetical protein
MTPLGADQMTIGVGRRQFISALGGVVATWPLAARAQQGESMRRIGVLTNLATGDPEDQARNAAFLQALQPLGWTVGRNVRIDYRWGAGDADRNRKYAAELVALAPDVILATGTPALAPLLQMTRIVPIVFVQIADPVGTGLVESLARPGGNATGFSTIDYGTSGKWLELLKEIAPNVTRVAVLRDDTTSSGIGQWAGIQASRTARVMMALMRNGRDRRLGKPVMGHAIDERVVLFGTRSADYIRASGQSGCIAMEASLQAKTGRIHDRTRTLRRKVRFPLAPRAPSIHDP